MSQSSIEDLIESAKDKKNQKYLRRSWIITARVKLSDADKELTKLEKEIGLK